MIRLLFIVIAILSTGCATTSLQPVTDKNFAFEEDEKRLWTRSEEEQKKLDSSGYIYQDQELESYLNDVAKRLTDSEAIKYIPFRIMVVKNHLLNAFAFPNGHIYIHTGILSRIENEAQLATLLSHEITHSTHRHTIRNYRDIKNKLAFLASFQVTFGAIGIVGLLGTIGTYASVMGYSQDLERESDLEGIKTVLKAGYDPVESPKLFEHLKKEIEDDTDIKEPFFFGSHPKLSERIDNYTDFLSSLNPSQKKGIKNTETFIEKTKYLTYDNAVLDLKAGRFKIAQRGAEKYIKLQPADSRGYTLLAEIHRQRNEKDDIDKAKSFYAKALSLNPSSPEPHKGLGLIYFKTGDKKLAKKSFENYLSISKNSDSGYIQDLINQCE